MMVVMKVDQLVVETAGTWAAMMVAVKADWKVDQTVVDLAAL
jgi:hypothetical protein